MILIAHRGNFTGSDPEKENHPDYIDQAIDHGYDVEVDVWSIDRSLMLGHDVPQYEISMGFLLDRSINLWCHAKNIEALSRMVVYGEDINCFWHQEDDVALTSRGYLWTYPGKELTMNSICVMPEKDNTIWRSVKPINCAGFCSDEIERLAWRNQEDENFSSPTL